MLKYRLISGTVMASAIISALLFLPPTGLLVVLLVVAVAAMLEYYSLLKQGGIPSSPLMGIIAGVSLIVATWYGASSGNWGLGDVAWLVILFFVMGMCLRQFPEKENQKNVETIASTILGFLYVAFLMNFVTKLLASPDWELATGRWLVVYLLLVVKCTDIGAFFVGCAFGKHKLIPHLSPKKSWEGVGGGIFAAVLVSCLFVHFAGDRLLPLEFELVDALILGFLLSMAGVQGDLVESLFKRAVGAKDSSGLIKGMGGILDVIDSPLFGAPMLYVYARLLL